MTTQSPAQLKRKLLRTVLSLGGGSAAGPSDTFTLDGYRTECDVEVTAGMTMGMAHVRIYGLSLDQMNRFTTISANFQEMLADNTISIYAGESEQNLSLVYQGDIRFAFGDFDDAPNVCLDIEAYAGAFSLLQPVQPSFYKDADVAVIMKKLAADAGWAFYNDGVNVKYRGQYIHGTIMQMVRQVAETANINYIYERGILTIWPRNQTRSGPDLHDQPRERHGGLPAVRQRGHLPQERIPGQPAGRRPGRCGELPAGSQRELGDHKGHA